MDCVPEDEHAACPDGGLRDLFLRGRFGEGLFLFDGDIAKLCGIKDFSASLAFNKLCVFLAGDDLDDWMFALGGHGEESRMLWILPVSGHLVNCDFTGFWRAICGEFVAECRWKCGCNVHECGRTLM